MDWERALDVLSGVWQAATSEDGLRAWVEGFGMLAPLAYFLMEAAQVVVSPLPGGLLHPVGALAFGPWAALALSMSGCAAGAAVVFALVRRCGRPLVQRLVRAETIERYAGVLATRGGLGVFVACSIPVFPADAICAIAGLSSISFRRFMVVSTLGRAPSVALAVFLTAELSSVTTPGWVLAAGTAALAVGAATLFINRARLERWLLGCGAEGRRRGWVVL